MATEDAPKTLQHAILLFGNYENCHNALVAVRWPDGVVKCPRCGSQRVTYLANARVWKCYEGHALAKFSLKVGTIFEDSPLPLQKWLSAVWLLTNCKNGISSHELARALGVTQKTAWFMLQRLRLALHGKDGGKLGGEVEVDETYHRRQGSQHAQVQARALGDRSGRFDGRKGRRHGSAGPQITLASREKRKHAADRVRLSPRGRSGLPNST